LKDCAVGWDNLPSFIFKENKNPLAKLLSHIINLSFAQGAFPHELKIANIIPIFKAGEKDIIGNYRPVSLLTTVSKVFEKAFYKRLSSFVTHHKILYNLQFGFRESHSTHMAVIKLLDRVIDSLDKGEFAAAIFLDFSKAFDTVNHNILLDKLNHYGIRGVANLWVKSYLENRKQFCTFDGTKSNQTTVLTGVPQGSILGPLLFLLYINDLGNIFKNLNPIFFADDSNLITSGKSIAELEQSINQETPLLTEWLHTNRLSLNLKKTHIMLFCPTKRQENLPISIFIEGQPIEVLEETKFLGIILDNRLSWKPHIAYTTKKLCSGHSLPCA